MERQKGLDLLRLLAGMAVVMLHYNFGYAFRHIGDIPIENRLFLYAMESVSISAVNVFLLISGFFLFHTEKRSYGKILYLLIFAIFVRVSFYLGNVVLGRYPFEWSVLCGKLIPRFYFVILYSATYLLSPYLNILIKTLSNKGLMYLLLFSFIILSLEPSLIDVLTNTTSLDWRGMNAISFFGGGGGQTLIHFIFMYIIGASLNKIQILDFLSYKWVAVFFVSTIFIFLSYTIFNRWIEVTYYNPFVIFQSLSLFFLFKNVHCATFLSKISKAAFACYLIHGQLLDFLNISYFIRQPLYVLIFHIVVSLVLIYLFSYVFMMVFDFVFKKPIASLNKININYFFEDGTTKDNTTIQNR